MPLSGIRHRPWAPRLAASRAPAQGLRDLLAKLRTAERILEGIENQTTAQTAGRTDEARHEALYRRWLQLRGVTALAMLLGLPPALREALQAHRDRLRDELQGGG